MAYVIDSYEPPSRLDDYIFKHSHSFVEEPSGELRMAARSLAVTPDFERGLFVGELNQEDKPIITKYLSTLGRAEKTLNDYSLDNGWWQSPSESFMASIKYHVGMNNEEMAYDQPFSYSEYHDKDVIGDLANTVEKLAAQYVR